MGISLDLYRARIGSFNNTKIKSLKTEGPSIITNIEEYVRLSSPPEIYPCVILNGKCAWKWSVCLLILLFAQLASGWYCPESHTQCTALILGCNTSSIIPFMAYPWFSRKKRSMVATTQYSEDPVVPISPCTIQSELVIGGVETKPGPLSCEDVLAELASQAQETSVRDCIRSYDPNQSSVKQKNTFTALTKDVLVETLEYLGLPNQEVHTKPTCVTILMRKLKNLLPKKCGICDEQYYVQRGKEPLLNCGICGQGSHDPCILGKLSVSEADKPNFTPADAHNKINPCGLPGLHYLCMDCEKSTIKEAEPTGRVRLQSTTDELPPSQENTDVTTDSNASAGDSSDTHNANASGSSTNSNDNPMPQAASNSKKICRFFQKNTCRHGITGKGCKFYHPKPCNKLLKHGTRTPHGCTLGKNKCENFHPKMCPSSLSKGECITTNCRLQHVRGTKFPMKESPQNSGSEAPNQAHQNRRDKKQDPKKSTKRTDTPASSPPSSNDFLESLRLLKLEMMEAMDLKLATIISTQTAAAPAKPQQSHPMPMYPPNHHWPQMHPWGNHQNNQYMSFPPLGWGHPQMGPQQANQAC